MELITQDFSIKILDTLTEQITVIDNQGNIVYVNNSWIEFSENNEGITKPTQWNKVNYLEISDNSAKSGDVIALEASKIIRSVINGNNGISYLEYPCHSPDEKRWFMMRVNLFKFNEMNYYVLSHQNITERKLAEIELKETQEMMIKQSRHVAMGEMISMLAHQWRQPLSIITTSINNVIITSMMGEFDLEKKEEVLKYQDFINDTLTQTNDTIQKLSKTIDNLTIFSNTDKLKVLVTLKEVCHKALDIINISLVDDKIELIYDYKSNKEHNLIVEELIQVIIDIIKNSQENFKYISIKNPKIKITINEDSISICDNGGGIPSNIIDKIFEPYFSTKNEKEETGLGLYMSKKIIEYNYNGNLLVNNQDSGVCFTIVLDNNIN